MARQKALNDSLLRKKDNEIVRLNKLFNKLNEIDQNTFSNKQSTNSYVEKVNYAEDLLKDSYLDHNL